MKILVIGAKGFIGSNLLLRLQELGHQVLQYDRNNSVLELDYFIQEADYIYNLAATNRSDNPDDFSKDNVEFVRYLVNKVMENPCYKAFFHLSSIQVETDPTSVYGLTKSQGEIIVKELGSKAKIIRLPNVFGKYSRPYYNSVIATFAKELQLGHELKIIPNQITLAYIDDVIDYLLSFLTDELVKLRVTLTTIKEIAFLLKRIHSDFNNLLINNDSLLKQQLFVTYISLLEPKALIKSFVSHQDVRGSFTEIIKSLSPLQVSLNIVKQGKEKGHHYHHNRVEFFIPLKNDHLMITFINPITKERFILNNQGEESLIIIPPGLLHVITTDDPQAEFIILSNVLYDINNSDTYVLKEQK